MNPAAPASVHPGRGIAMVIAAAGLWGMTGTAQSFAHPALAATWIGCLRLAVSAVFFGAWIAAFGPRGWKGRWPWRRTWLAAVCMTVYNLAFFAGVRNTGVAVGTAIAIGSGPVWAGVLQWIVRGQAPDRRWWAGTAIAVAGGALMILGRGGAAHFAFDGFGIGACLLAGLSYATYALVNKTLVAEVPAGTATGAVFGLAALMALPMAWALAGPPVIEGRDVVVVAWLGVMSTGVAYLLFSHALRHVSGPTGVALALAEPCVAFGLAVAVVGERPGWLAFAGLLGVLVGLALVIRAELAGTGGVSGAARRGDGADARAV